MSKPKPTDDQIKQAKAAKAAKAAAKDAAQSGDKHLKETKPSVVRLRDKYRNDVIPALRAEGVSEADIRTMTVDNPRRVFERQGAY